LPSTVEKLSSTRAKLTIEVPFAEFEPAIRKAYRDLANQVSIPGFRKGHIPPAMIDARLGRGAVLNEAVNAVLPQIYAQTVEEHGLTPLGRPDIEMTKLEDGEIAEFSAEVDIAPDFDLPDFSAITVTVDPPADLDAAVDRQIEILRERFAEVSDTDRPAGAGDLVHLNLTGAQHGEVLPDASATGVTYVIGSGGMLDGLDEAVTGCHAGDVKTFASTLVGGGHEDEPADITVAVTQVQERTLPKVDDDFAQLVSQFDTVAEMKQDLRASVERAARIDQLVSARDKVLDAALDLAGIDIPEHLVETELESRTAQLNEQLRAAGLTLDDYLSRMGDPAVTNAEQFAASTRSSVERQIRGEILLSRAADEEKVSVDQEDLTNFIFQKAQENGTTPDQEVQHMQAHNHLAEWMAQIRQSKALDAMVAKATVTDTQGRPVAVTTLAAPAVDAG